VRIKGIGRKMVRRLRAHLAVGGPSTATAALARAVPVPPSSPPPQPATKHPSPPLACVRAPVRPARPLAHPSLPTHGACPPPP
jgi:hypothetical protein